MKKKECVKVKKLIVCVISLAILVPAAFADNLITGKGEQWKVYNVEPATSSYWDINKAQIVGTTVQFPIQQFITQDTGSFAVYLLNNYNVSMTTSQTIAANVSWTPAGTYETRSTACAATPGYVRLEFQDVTSGPYNPNDYWWSTTYLDLNAGTSGSLSVSLDPANWTNLDGQTGTGNVGFTKAMKNVKLIGLSFGSSCRYASGVALVGATGTFTLTSFTVQ
jgi:hypothetical protein